MEMLTGEEDSSTWTSKMLSLMRRAYIFDIGEREVENRNLDEAGEGCSHNLGHEHCSGWDLVWLVDISCATSQIGLTFR